MSEYVWECLREDEEFILYRARASAAEVPSVLLLTLASTRPRLESLKKIEHEYSLRHDLDTTWAVRPLAFSQCNGQNALVLEDPGGEFLHRLIQGPMEIKQFLRIAIGLATALGHAHRQGLLHKDVKPANVLVDDSGSVWLTGFGIASQLPRERQMPEPPEFIAGTLAYMAPEQTGRMNRSIDSRSDLYALGVTLYEMLTGTLPFMASDPMELVHCHIARQPTPPAVKLKAIPDPVSAIIMKLLAKTAEDRYQTAVGVESDLRRCLAEWKTQRRIDEFPLGEHDTPDQLLIPEKLYGRASEIGTLLAAFDRIVAGGRPELVLVSGYSGIGKSSVVNELHKSLVPPRGLFASGKFDQYKRDIPYATLAQAFQSLVRPLLGRSEVEIGRWRDALREAVGPNGQLIVNLVPELELVIGKQPPVAELPPQDAQRRFQRVFRRFLGVFARKEHPLVLFLDDLQWLDPATLELFERLITDPDVRYLMLVGAYRDNEVTSSHPLTQTLDAIRKAGARMQEIVLAPLRVDDIDRLVADALHSERNVAQPLAQLVHEKTSGNPFFAIQFLTALADELLLRFDPDAAAWIWDLARIRAKGYTDNVVDLMAGKLKRLSATTQEALKQLACLGNVAEVATLALVHREMEEAIHTALWEAVRAGLIFQEESTYKFLHDRIQEAAYALIPESERATEHVRIGRVLMASVTGDALVEHVFDVANQFNRGAALLIDRDEKAHVAAIDLSAGRKARASAAYTSARGYFSAGMALLDEGYWDSHYELMFSLWLERAECELLSGNFEKTEQLIVELLERGESKVDQAAIHHLKVQLHELKGEYPQGVDSALTCLRLFGIDLPAHPTLEQVQAEYETVWQTLNGRPIESLIDLPMMTDPELQSAMQVLSVLAPAAYFTDFHLFCVRACRVVTISMQHGTSGVSAHAYGYLGFILGPVFHRYGEAYRCAKLSCDLVEKHGFIALQAKVYYAMGTVAFWTQPIGTAIDFMRKTFRSGIETGDLTFACYGAFQSVTGLLLRNDPLDSVWREAERALGFAREAKFGDAADITRSQQRFIATMQGQSATFSTFSDAQFDEATFEAQLTGDRMALMICWYWILKLKARFLSGDYAEALAAADKAKPLLSSAAAQIQLLDYYYYAALAVAARYENASADKQQEWCELLTAHREQLREWAESHPPTFTDKHALVSAEIARLEGRELDAMRLYEQAIHSARDHGFVQNEALAYEVAARFYAARGFENIAKAYLQHARYGYLRWGANGKVKQLDHLYPHLVEESPAPSPTSTTVASVELLDLTTVVKVSQAVSGEMVLEKLIDRLMRAALEQAGAERGLLIVSRRDELQIEAEAATSGDDLIIHLRDASTAAAAMPESLVHYVMRTQEALILEDASSQNPFSADPYIIQRRPRSILTLPLINQGKLISILHLENNLTPHVFTPDRITVLKVLASQAAISLENTRLYRDLEDRERRIRRLVDANILGIFLWNLEGAVVEANEAFLHMLQYGREDVASGRVRWTDVTPLEWRERDERALAELKATGMVQPYEKEYFRKDGSRLPVQLGAALFEGSGNEGVAFVLDLSDQKRVEEALRKREAYLTESQRLAHTGSWALDGTTREARYWSEEMFRIFGFDPQQGFPKRDQWLQRIHPDDRDKVERQASNRMFVQKVDSDVEFRIVLPDGTVKHIHGLTHPAFGPNEELIEVVGTVVDITERKHAEEARDRLRQLEADLAHINRVSTMGELTASLAHEIKQPIGAAVTNAEACLRLLDRKQPDVPEAREAALEMVKDARRAADIIDRVRSLYEKGSPQLEIIDINELVKEMVAVLHNEAKRHSVVICTDLPEGLPAVMADRVHLQQALMNLMLNGIEAMRDTGGELRIKSQLAEDGQVLISVTDAGVGLPTEKTDQIFNAFFTTKPHGTGLGLAITRSIVESHGGRVWAAPNSGQGATFYFTLPSGGSRMTSPAN
jgi:PAS domain S-box-containing protein